LPKRFLAFRQTTIIINISGAAGDLFVTIKFSRFPKDILVRDYGVGMTVFSKESEEI